MREVGGADLLEGRVANLTRDAMIIQGISIPKRWRDLASRVTVLPNGTTSYE